EVFNILLQVLDNGRLTDSKGKTVNFKNSIIILTSNVGSEFFRKMSSLGFSNGEEASRKEDEFRDKAMLQLKQTFKPEFLNRLDEIVIFNALAPVDMKKIVDIQLAEVEERLKSKGISVVIKPEVKEYLVKNGFDPDYGARPVKRLIQKVIVDALADKMVRGNIKDGQKISITLNKSNGVEVVV
ncbi:MAG: AAA family ATPase, partial [Patescibacteria group bacterium]